MMDLRNHLDSIASPGTPPDSAQVEADIARGRHALRRRRANRTAAGSALGAAVLVAAFAVGSGMGTGVGTPAPGTDRPAVVAQAQLVAYTGQQPKGYTIDKVPAGWFVQADNNYGLTLAPTAAQNPGQGADPSKEPIYDKRSYEDKIGVFLESKDQDGPPRKGIEVKVGDRDGTLVKSLPGMTPDGPEPTPADGDTGWSLWVQQPSGTYLIVQFWEGVGFSQDQMVELAAGVHVHPEAEQAAG